MLEIEKIKKTNGINDIDLEKIFTDYNDILTDNLWNFPNRGEGGCSKFHGNFIPQIPAQIMTRFSKKGDWVADFFIGSGTTAYVAAQLNRNIVCTDISEAAIKNAKIEHARFPDTKSEIRAWQADAHDLTKTLTGKPVVHPEYSLVFTHPPYFSAVSYSCHGYDLSNCYNVDGFLEEMEEVYRQIFPLVKPKGHLCIVMGDLYKNGEHITLAHDTIARAKKVGFKLKSMIVKNIGETKAKGKNNNLWRWRAFKNGFYIFRYEYIAVLQKEK